MNIPGPSDLYQAYQHRTKKRFGQHFLTDSQILNRILDVATHIQDRDVVEIGPGCGALTGLLMARGARTTAIEIDRNAAAFLRSELGPFGLELIEGDVLELDLSPILADQQNVLVVSNLPYNAATAIFFALLDLPAITEMVLMFQKEVAERIVAEPGAKNYGSLALATTLRCDARLVMKVKAGSFSPPPKVDGAVLHITPVPDTRIKDEETRTQFEKLIRAAFQQRRKTLKNSLSPLVSKDLLSDWLEEEGLPQAIRPERLSFEHFHKLARMTTN